MRILYNAIQTPDKTILESHFTYDCKIYVDKVTKKTYGVDGGLEYAKRIGDINDCRELLIYDDKNHQTRRNYLKWGRNYDSSGDKLSETQWILIRDLEIDHINSIIRNCNLSKFFKEILENELSFRNKGILKN